MTRAGDEPRSRRVLRLIALERSVRSVLLLAAGVYLLTHLKSDFGRIADHFMRALELDPRRPFLHRIVVRLHRLHVRALLISGVGAIGYGLLELAEGVGLWLDQLWAEYLTVIATGILIPYEAYEVILHPTLFKVGALLLNLAVVGYLAYRKRLFVGI